MKGLEIFKKGRFENADMIWAFWLVILILISLVISVIDPSKHSASVYKDIGFFVIALVALGFMGIKLAKKLPFSFVGIAADKKTFAVSVGAGLGIAVLLVGSQLFGTQSFLSPLSMPALSVATVGALAAIFMASMYVSEIEETLRSSTLLPTFMNFIAQVPVHLTFFVLGAVVYFVLALQTIGLLLVGLGALALLAPKFAAKFKTTYFVAGISVVITGIIFASFHLLAYQASENLLLSAFAFAVIADSINLYLGNTIASRIAHTTNNATLALVAASLPAYYALVIAGSHAALLYFFNNSKMIAV